MRITAVNQNINFTRQLNQSEREDMLNVHKKSLSALGNDGGKRIFIMPDTCMPQNAENNTGIGLLSSRTAKNYLNDMDYYLNYTHVKVLPFGKPDGYKDFFCNYAGTVMSPGVQHINLELLKEDEFGKILTNDEYKEVIKENLKKSNQELVNFHNIIDDGSPHDLALRKAYERFKTSTHPKITELKSSFQKFAKENDDWLDKYSIYYGVLQKEHNYEWFNDWDELDVDKHLFNPKFDSAKRKARLNEIHTVYKEELDFYKFKQFLASEHFLIGKENINKMGKKLITDCPITFDDALVWAHPDAFIPHPTEVGWGLPMFNYKTIHDPSSEASKLLMRKIERTAMYGDCVRMDVGWQYFQSLARYENGDKVKRDFGTILIDRIEETVKKVKGKDFDLSNIMYEFDSDPKEFTPFVNDELTPASRRAVKIYNSCFTNEGWGNNNAFTRLFGEDKYIAGLNHDPKPLRLLAENSSQVLDYGRENHLKALANFFHTDTNSFRNPAEFMKAKFAEIVSGKNYMNFYMNIFGRRENFQREMIDGVRNYGFRVPEKYEKEYNKAIQSGFGLNMMDALERLFKRAGLDKTKKELYDKIVYYRDELYKADPEEAVTAAIQNSEKQTSKSSNKTMKIIIGCTAAAAVIGAGIYAYMAAKSKQKVEEPEPEQIQSNSTVSNQYQNFVKPSSFLHS